MEIYRFDKEIAVPVSAEGSDFRIGQLVSENAEVVVQVRYVSPGGGLPRDVSSSRRMLAVLTGVALAANGNDRRALSRGYAAVWEVGEPCSFGTAEGFTAVWIEGEFEVWAVDVTTDIVVTEYDSEWVTSFELLRREIWPVVADLALRIEHVGSTAVRGLAAKPIIDMDIVVSSDDKIPGVIDRLSTVGYRWRGDLGVPGREAFRRTVDDGMPRHHLYLVVENSKPHLDHWLLRDLLRDDSDARQRYSDLKKRNAELAGRDIDVYVEAKAELVAELLTRARRELGLPAASYWEPTIDLTPE